MFSFSVVRQNSIILKGIQFSCSTVYIQDDGKLAQNRRSPSTTVNSGQVVSTNGQRMYVFSQQLYTSSCSSSLARSPVFRSWTRASKTNTHAYIHTRTFTELDNFSAGTNRNAPAKAKNPTGKLSFSFKIIIIDTFSLWTYLTGA